MHRTAAVAVVSFLLTSALHAADSVQSILDSKALQSDYNPVLVSFLFDEGKDRLSAKQHKLALDQQLAGLRSAAGLKAASDAAAELWTAWVDAAFVLLKAGYKQDVVPFLKNCIESFPYESLQSRCAMGFVFADPENAVAHLMSMLARDRPQAVTNAALRILGEVAGDDATPRAHRDAIVAELIRRTEGVINAIYYEAAIEGLLRAKDGRAVEPLQKMTRGPGRSDEVKQAALRGLVLTYKDSAVAEQLRKALKGNDQLFAAVTLIEAGDAAGFDYALQRLTPQKKGKAKADADPAPALVRALRARGDERSREVLTRALEGRAENDPLWPSIHVALLELGDASRVETVKTIVAGNYDATMRFSGVMALAKNDLESAVAPLVSLLGDSSPGIGASAAYALAQLSSPAALDGLAKAFETSYERSSVVHAHVVRTAAAKFPKDARTKALLDKAKASPSASVKFMALSLTKKK